MVEQGLSKMLRRQTQKKAEGRLKIQVGGDILVPLKCGDRAQHTGEGPVSCTGRAPSPLRWAGGSGEGGRSWRCRTRFSGRANGWSSLPKISPFSGRQIVWSSVETGKAQRGDRSLRRELKMTISSAGLWGGELSQETCRTTGHDWVPSRGWAGGGPNIQGYEAVYSYPLALRVSAERWNGETGLGWGFIYRAAGGPAARSALPFTWSGGGWFQDGAAFSVAGEGARARKKLADWGTIAQ